MRFLADINFWLALAFDFHGGHPAAKNWFDGQTNESVVFCRLTQQGFLRLASNPSVMKQDAVSLIEAWGLYDALSADDRVTFAAEPAGVEALWRGYTQLASFSPKVWSDAWLAAFARAADWQVATFDRGFLQYRDLKCTILPSP